MTFKELFQPDRFRPYIRTREAKRIATTTTLGLVCALIYVILAPNWYQSTLTVVPAAQSKGVGLGAQLAGALAIELPGDLAGNVDVERIAAVLESTSVTDAVIQKFDLIERYDQKHIEDARKKLWTHCFTKIDRKAKLVSLTCEDKTPGFVKSMLEYFGDYGNQVFRRVSTSSASEEVKFLERRVAEMRKEADEAARRLRAFEESYKVVDLESQSKAVVSAMASLRSQKISKELQLSYLNSFSSRDESTGLQIRQQLAAVNSKFKAMEEEPSTGNGADATAPRDRDGSARPSADIFPAALAVPKLRFEFEQVTRDRKIRETDLVLLMQRLEMAKVNEARDTSAFLILDMPPLPTHRARPKRVMILAVGGILSVLCGLAWAFGRNALSLQAQAPRRGTTSP
jgi:tyrosine-protein kinase Etk/Wzc